MNKLVVLCQTLVILCFAAYGFGISSVPGTGTSIDDSSREYHFAYHQNNDDLHWYGTHKWAVRFNFREVYPTMTSAQFQITKALLYLPVLGNDVLVELFEDQAGQPLAIEPIQTVQALVDEHHMVLEFPEPVQAEIVWMIVSYQTNFYGPYVSASLGGGSRSYFLNSNAAIPYYQSMLAGGYNCELNFGVMGDFIMSEMDLKLVDFDLHGDLSPNREVNPTFTIYNHSDQIIQNATLNVTISTPLTPLDTIESTIPISEILPREYLVVDSTTPGFGQYPIRLPDYATQIRVSSVLSSAYDDIEPTGNNTIIKYKSVFTDEFPFHLVENFLRNDNIGYISNLQDQFDLPQFLPLYYFPVAGDTLYNMGASQRFNWYGYNSLPRTVVGGSKQLIGYQTDYADDYQNLTTQARENRTFISDYNCRLSVPEQGEMVGVDITLSNSRTRLYSTVSDLNLMTGSRFYVGLFKKHNLNGSNRLVLDRWIAYRDTINTGLGFGSSTQKIYSTTLTNINMNTLHENYAVVYWLQHNTSKQILFSALCLFEGGTSIEEELLPPPVFSIVPNPLRSQQALALKFSSIQDMQSLRVGIYNLRGQQIYNTEVESKYLINNELTINASLFPASGIYFVKTSYINTQGRRIIVNGKLSVIK